MRENARLYLLISLGVHACLVFLLFLLEGPRVSEVIPRRVVIEFANSPERTPEVVSPERSRLPDLEPRELAESLQMQGPKTLSIPGARSAADSQKQRLPGGGERLAYTRTEQPLVPELTAPAAVPALPPELLSREIESPKITPTEQSGFSEAGALEWRGRERKLLRAAGIAFPDILLEEGLEVDVVAVFTVAASGQVIDVDIVRSSGYASVDRAVERTILGYLFEPSENAGEDVCQIQYRFRLERGD
jgi:TonB family protein